VSEQEAQVVDKPGSTAGGTAARAGERDSPARGSSLLAWLALLLVIPLGLGAAWVVREGQHREDVLAQRLTALESAVGGERHDFAQISERWREQLQSGLDKLQSSLDEETASLGERVAARDAELKKLQEELGRFSASDRNSWLLAEAGHLLRLANQRLVMAQDPVAALALLSSADAVLREIDDPALHPVRAALAADIAALRAVPRVDIEGIYLRLAALIEQADTLVIFQFPKQAERPGPEPARDWKGRLRQGYEAALAKLSSYLVIRRRDVPMQALMDPQWEGLVRQNLRMLLEQAQVALLSGNQTLYSASLERALQWVAQFRESDPATARAITQEIKKLSGLTIGVPQPDIARSLRAMDAAIEQRQSPQGGQ